MTPWGVIDYGYSKHYEGKWATFKTKLKSKLHKLGIKNGLIALIFKYVLRSWLH